MANENLHLDAVFHALADPTRRAVIARLGKGPVTVKELSRPFRMALPSFLKHIAVLEKSRLIVSEKQGRIRTCALEQANLLAAEQWFGEQHLLWQGRHNNLDALLIQLDKERNDV